MILTSSTTTTRALPVFIVYGATKAAIRNLARHRILVLKDRRIRVNAISPGPTTTLGHLADPVEIGNAVVFLASDDSSFVNSVELSSTAVWRRSKQIG